MHSNTRRILVAFIVATLLSAATASAVEIIDPKVYCQLAEPYSFWWWILC